jgi:Leucine-rich repeat (LRR) protein
MEFREVTDELDLIRTKFPKDLLIGFSQRLTKLYLNFGMIKHLSFLDLFPLLKVFYISNNKLTSLQGIECVTNLNVLVFDNNNIESLEPLT